MALGGGRLHRHAHVPLLASGLPHLVRDSAVRKGWQSGACGGRPTGSVHERQALHQVPDARRVPEPSRPSEVPHEARRRARREQVGAYLVGRGLRRDRGAGEGHLGDGRRQRHHLRARNRAQHQLAGAVLRPSGPEDAEHLDVRVHRILLLHAAHLRQHRAFRRLPHRGRVRDACGPLRQRRVDAAGGAGGVGERAARVERRRLRGPLAGAVRADGDEDRLHRPKADVVGRARRALVADTSRNRCRACLRLAERHHRGGAVRQGVCRCLVFRLRRACRVGARDDARMGGGDMRFGSR